MEDVKQRENIKGYVASQRDDALRSAGGRPCRSSSPCLLPARISPPRNYPLQGRPRCIVIHVGCSEGLAIPQACTQDEIDEAFAAAKTAQKLWAKTPL